MSFCDLRREAHSLGCTFFLTRQHIVCSELELPTTYSRPADLRILGRAFSVFRIPLTDTISDFESAYGLLTQLAYPHRRQRRVVVVVLGGGSVVVVVVVGGAMVVVVTGGWGLS